MTDIDIVNAALAELGSDAITILDDSTATGSLCKRVYAPIRDAMLESRDWSFAISRDTLVKSAQAPAFGYANKFALPNGCLRVITCLDENLAVIDDFVREGQFILTDSDICKARTVVQVSENFFSPLFTKALIAQLAADLAIPVTENRTIADSWEQKAQARLQEASSSDGKQGRSEVRTTLKLRGRRR